MLFQSEKLLRRNKKVLERKLIKLLKDEERTQVDLTPEVEVEVLLL